jgi:hypothetical protein
MRFFALLAVGFVVGCAPSSSNRSAQCFCPEKFDGAECVTSDDFVPPENCEDDGTPVCGCDGQGYTSECAAYAIGVQVAYAGQCNAGGNNGGGFDFGW